DPSTTPVIASAVRTPIGKFLGGLSPLSAPDLGAVVVREAVGRAGISPERIDEVILGHVVQAGAGQASARQAAIGGGVPSSIPAVTINKVCGSGLKAVMLAAQAIRAGDGAAFVAGGMESMSNAPYLLRGHRTGVKLGHGELLDGVIHDGLWCSFGQCHMGGHAEYTARKAMVSRSDADAFALESHRRAVAAIDSGRFRQEIVSVEVPARGGPVRIDTDEAPRRDTSLESLAKLPPAFPPAAGEEAATELVVTAGN